MNDLQDLALLVVDVPAPLIAAGSHNNSSIRQVAQSPNVALAPVACTTSVIKWLYIAEHGRVSKSIFTFAETKKLYQYGMSFKISYHGGR